MFRCTHVLHRQNMFGHADLHSLVHAINKIPLAACRNEAHRQKLLFDHTQLVQTNLIVQRCFAIFFDDVNIAVFKCQDCRWIDAHAC